MALKIEVELSDGTIMRWSKDFVAAGISAEDGELMEDEVLAQMRSILGFPDTTKV